MCNHWCNFKGQILDLNHYVVPSKIIEILQYSRTKCRCTAGEQVAIS